jgi:hypothetical protein
MFKKAEKSKQKLRLAIEGASGSGKTYSGLILAESISGSGRIAVIDSENGSASLYSDRFSFDVLEITPPYSPEKYIEAIKAAESAGYSVLLIDSITHEWNGDGGVLDIVTKIGGNSFQAWAKATPRHDNFINKILSSPLHIIATMRSKAAYELSKDDKSGKLVIEKKGTAPIQRDSVDYEFTTVFDLNKNHSASASKDRTGLFDGKDFIITEEIGKQFLSWLNSGVAMTEKPIADAGQIKTPKPAPTKKPSADEAFVIMKEFIGLGRIAEVETKIGNYDFSPEQLAELNKLIEEGRKHEF